MPEVRFENCDLDFSEVRGCCDARRALQIAAAGGHSILMVGKPGTGRVLLARRLPTIMPQMDEETKLRITNLYSKTGTSSHTIKARPFRAPHNSSSERSLLGDPRQGLSGEFDLARDGVLFLDEVNDFAPSVLRSLNSVKAKTLLVGGASDCCCLRLRNDPCTCGGRHLDRLTMFDMRVNLSEHQFTKPVGDPSWVMRESVNQAQLRQLERAKELNANVPMEMLRALRIEERAQTILDACANPDTALRIARTIADLNLSETILPEHAHEANNLLNL